MELRAVKLNDVCQLLCCSILLIVTLPVYYPKQFTVGSLNICHQTLSFNSCSVFVCPVLYSSSSLISHNGHFYKFMGGACGTSSVGINEKMDNYLTILDNLFLGIG